MKSAHTPSWRVLLICMVRFQIYTGLFNHYCLCRSCSLIAKHTTFSFVVRCRQPIFFAFLSLTQLSSRFFSLRLSPILDMATCLRSKSCFMKNERLSLSWLRLCKSWCSALLFPCYTSSESCFYGSEILSKEKTNRRRRPTHSQEKSFPGNKSKDKQ